MAAFVYFNGDEDDEDDYHDDDVDDDDEDDDHDDNDFSLYFFRSEAMRSKLRKLRNIEHKKAQTMHRDKSRAEAAGLLIRIGIELKNFRKLS